jgi:iron complex transport system permease protein
MPVPDDIAAARDHARAAVAHVRRSAHRRAATVWVTLAALVFVAFSFEISLGEYHVAVTDVIPAIFGNVDPITDLIVGSVRLPRALCALIAGVAFGCSGAMFQSLARNPLASPDIIGVNIGASAAAVFVIVTVTSASYDLVSAGAFAGALLTAIAIYLLAYRQGLSPFRLVLVGIGVGEMLASVLAYLLTRADIWDAQQAARWLAGSLDFRGYEHVTPAAIGLAVLLPLACVLVGPLTSMLLGDETATGIGVRVERSRAMLLVVAVGLAALAVVASGPVLFVAFLAPPIARQLTRAPVALIASGLVGGLLVLSADLIGRFAFGDVELPVGVVTALLGAPYLIWLLARANKVGGMG